MGRYKNYKYIKMIVECCNLKFTVTTDENFTYYYLRDFPFFKAVIKKDNLNSHYYFGNNTSLLFEDIVKRLIYANIPICNDLLRFDIDNNFLGTIISLNIKTVDDVIEFSSSYYTIDNPITIYDNITLGYNVVMNLFFDKLKKQADEFLNLVSKYTDMEILYFNSESKFFYPTHKNMIDSVKYVNSAYPILLDIMKKEKTQHINLWYRGSSGCILSTLLITKLMNNMPLDKIQSLYIRKRDENSHGSNNFRNINYVEPYELNVIIDDFIDTGNTLNEIYTVMKYYNVIPNVIILNNEKNTLESKLEYLNFKPQYVISANCG